jgi:hypothetical protein
MSALRAGRPLTPGRFLVLISVRGWVDPRDIVRLEGLGKLKNPMTSGIEPMTFQLVAQCLYQLRYCAPTQVYGVYKTSLRVHRQWPRSLHYHLQSYHRISFQHIKRTKTATPKIFIQGLFSIRLPTQGMMYPQRCLDRMHSHREQSYLLLHGDT